MSKMDLDNEDTKTALVILGMPTLVILMVIAMLPLGLFSAWVVQKMYIWFLLPLGLPALNLWHIWGIVLLINYLKPDSSKEYKTVGKFITDVIVKMILAFILLGIAYFIKGRI